MLTGNTPKEAVRPPSPRDTILAGILVLISMSFLVGIFLMRVVQEAARGDSMWSFLPIPLLVLAIALHIRRMLKAVSLKS
jgi:hypothetical protein